MKINAFYSLIRIEKVLVMRANLRKHSIIS